MKKRINKHIFDSNDVSWLAVALITACTFICTFVFFNKLIGLIYSVITGYMTMRVSGTSKGYISNNYGDVEPEYIDAKHKIIEVEQKND